MATSKHEESIVFVSLSEERTDSVRSVTGHVCHVSTWHVIKRWD